MIKSDTGTSHQLTWLMAADIILMSNRKKTWSRLTSGILKILQNATRNDGQMRQEWIYSIKHTHREKSKNRWLTEESSHLEALS